MTQDSPTARSLRAVLAQLAGPGPQDVADYRIASSLAPGFVGLARNGSVAFLVPLETVPTAAGRRGGGFSLSVIPQVEFDHEGRRWQQAAAALECTQADMLDVFLTLVVDIAHRLNASPDALTWQSVIECVDEWQALLARRDPMTIEQQLGLWAELWVLSISAEPDRLLAAWRGPEAASADFFLNGIGLEIKASRRRLSHHVSQEQVYAPLGQHEAYLMSVWVGIEPGQGKSLAELVDATMERVSNASDLLKHIALAGYSPADREEYGVRFVVLEAPSWFPIESVPRVRSIDVGISRLRYVVALDPHAAADSSTARRLWLHFCATEPLFGRDVAAR